MSVTIEEIDAFVDRLMNESPGEDYVDRLGRKVWHLKHKIADTYGCPTCRDGAITLTNMEHDVVNVHLGKPVFDEKAFEKGVRMVLEAWHKHKHGPGGVNVKIAESFKEEAHGVRIGQ
jgi:hypothetical protein